MNVLSVAISDSHCAIVDIDKLAELGELYLDDFLRAPLKFETMRSRSNILMFLSARDCRGEIATGNFRAALN